MHFLCSQGSVMILIIVKLSLIPMAFPGSWELGRFLPIEKLNWDTTPTMVICIYICSCFSTLGFSRMLEFFRLIKLGQLVSAIHLKLSRAVLLVNIELLAFLLLSNFNKTKKHSTTMQTDGRAWAACGRQWTSWIICVLPTSSSTFTMASLVLVTQVIWPFWNGINLYVEPKQGRVFGCWRRKISLS